MSPGAVLELVGQALGVLLGGAALTTLVARLLVLPWLRANLVVPTKETARQLTVNRHVSPEPTMRDKLDTVQSQVARLDGRMAGHFDESSTDRAALWREINQLKADQLRRDREHRRRQ